MAKTFNPYFTNELLIQRIEHDAAIFLLILNDNSLSVAMRLDS